MRLQPKREQKLFQLTSAVHNTKTKDVKRARGIKVNNIHYAFSDNQTPKISNRLLLDLAFRDKVL